MSRRLSLYLLVCICLVWPLASGCSIRDDEPGGDEVLFVREGANGGRTIYLMRDDGREIRRLVAGDSPHWSPDGTRFAYYRKFLARSVWVMNPDTGEKRRIASADGISAFAWAPDGVRLAYVAASQIFVMDTETGDSEPVSIDYRVPARLDWSPDGHELLVSNPAVTILDLRTGAEHGVAPRVYLNEGRWSPDGERLALTAWNSPYNPRRKAFDLPADGVLKSTIVVADREGGNRERLTSGAFDDEPAWSDDGKRIYFTRTRPVGFDEEAPEESQIYVVDLETRSLRRLTNSAGRNRSLAPRPSHRSLPDPPERPPGEVVVPDLVGRHVLVEDERRRFRSLGLKLRAFLPFPDDGWLFVVHRQVPRGGSRVPRGTVVRLDGDELATLYAHFAKRFSAAAWKAHRKCNGDRQRSSLYWDLARRVLRRGMPRDRVISLLGEPEKADGGSSAWPVGRLSVEPVGCIYLRVEFDRRDRVTRFGQSLR